MFLKIAVPKNFAVLSRNTCAGIPFNKIAGLKACIFIKKDTPTQVFSCEYCKIFKKSFFYRTPPVHYTFPKFYVIIEFFGCLWVQNFLCHCFVFLHNSIRIRIPWLFRICFHTPIFSKCNFLTHNVGPSTIPPPSNLL